jgi:hypothetical protein
MALVSGDLVVSAAVVTGVLTAGSVIDGTNEILFGIFTIPSSTRVLWNTGVTQDAVGFDGLRKCAIGVNQANVGRDVSVSGYSPAFNGVITAAVQMELSTVGGTGALTEVYVLETEAAGDVVVLPSQIIFLD